MKKCTICGKRQPHGKQAKYCKLCKAVALSYQIKNVGRLNIGDAIIKTREEIGSDDWIYESNANCKVINIKNDCITVQYDGIMKVEYTPYEWYRLRKIKRKRRFFCTGCEYWKERNGYRYCKAGLLKGECKKEEIRNV